MFGAYDEPRRFTEREFDLARNQVFATEEFAPLVEAMQSAPAAGRGIVAHARAHDRRQRVVRRPGGAARHVVVARRRGSSSSPARGADSFPVSRPDRSAASRITRPRPLISRAARRTCSWIRSVQQHADQFVGTLRG